MTPHRTSKFYIFLTFAQFVDFGFIKCSHIFKPTKGAFKVQAILKGIAAKTWTKNNDSFEIMAPEGISEFYILFTFAQFVDFG